MKTFALVENNIVTNVSIGDDDWEKENWIDCKNQNVGIGYTYNKNKDAFIAPKPNCGHDELTLNTADYRWYCENVEHDITKP